MWQGVSLFGARNTRTVLIFFEARWRDFLTGPIFIKASAAVPRTKDSTTKPSPPTRRLWRSNQIVKI